MFGGNPNSTVKGPLQPHHLMQQTGAHNNQGAGGVLAGRMANQSPAPGVNLNSTQSVISGARGVGNGRPMTAEEAGRQNYLDRIAQIAMTETSLQQSHGQNMGALRPSQYSHIDALTSISNQRIRDTQRQAAAMRQQQALQNLLMQRDERLAQQGAPRSGTHLFYGF